MKYTRFTYIILAVFLTYMTYEITKTNYINSEKDIINTEWVLYSYKHNDIEKYNTANFTYSDYKNYSLNLNKVTDTNTSFAPPTFSKSINGKEKCNSFSGDYELMINNHINMDITAKTEVYCELQLPFTDILNLIEHYEYTKPEYPWESKHLILYNNEHVLKFYEVKTTNLKYNSTEGTYYSLLYNDQILLVTTDQLKNQITDLSINPSNLSNYICKVINIQESENQTGIYMSGIYIDFVSLNVEHIILY